MKMRVTVPVLAAAGLMWSAAAAQPLGTAFTYQGRLTDAGTPASGTYDFQFALRDAAGGGGQVGPTLTRDDVSVTEGVFTVSLDFGPVFAGSARWLEISVRPGASTGAYTPLAPRQELTPSPNAAFSLTTPWSGIANKPAGFADDVDNDSGGDISSVSAGTGLAGGGAAGDVTLSVNPVVTQSRVLGECQLGQSIRVINQDGNVVCEMDDDAPAWGLSGNAGTFPGTSFIGTTDAQPLDLRVGGASALRLEPTVFNVPNIIGGYFTNAAVGVTGAVIGGGGGSSASNQVTGDYGTVGGGEGNTASAYAAVPGGQTNQAGGRFSLAAGHRAQVRNATQSGDADGDEGTFVWADNQAATVTSTGPNQFLVRAAGGVGINTPSPSSALDVNGTATVTGFRLTTAPAAGAVLTSNASGVGAWAMPVSGDITAVTAGNGLTGGGPSGDVTLSANFGGTGAAITVSRSDHDHVAANWIGNVSGPTFNVANLAAVQNGSDTVSGVRGIGVYGVLGESASVNGRGVVGRHSSISGSTYGVYGLSLSTSGRGVYGIASNGSGVNYGVYGETNSAAGYAGYFAGRVGILAGTAPQGDLQIGQASDTTAFRFGNAGARHHLISNRDMVFNGWDIDGIPTTTPLFLWRKSSVLFDENGAQTLMTVSETGNLTVMGNALVVGVLAKGAGTFKIDHPLDPENKYLYHSFVESPDMKNMYDGIAVTDSEGYATVELPDWFEALNRDFRYQLTVIDDGEAWVMAKVVREVSENRFVLRTSVPGTKVSWQVTGIRHDAFAEKNRIQVEEDKPEAERGRYLHPAEHGQPATKGIEASPR